MVCEKIKNKRIRREFISGHELDIGKCSFTSKKSHRKNIVRNSGIWKSIDFIP